MPDLLALARAADPALLPALVAGVALITGLGLPGPATLLLVLAGVAAGAGAADAALIWAAGTAGAVAGDAGGYRLGGQGGPALRRRAAGRPRLAALLTQAEAMLAARGLAAVFVTRWLIPPLAPAVSLAAGAAGLALVPFLMLSLVGRTLWVALYGGIGLALGEAAEEMGQALASWTGLLAVALALGVAVAAARVLRRGAGGAGGG